MRSNREHCAKCGQDGVFWKEPKYDRSPSEVTDSVQRPILGAGGTTQLRSAVADVSVVADAMVGGLRDAYCKGSRRGGTNLFGEQARKKQMSTVMLLRHVQVVPARHVSERGRSCLFPIDFADASQVQYLAFLHKPEQGLLWMKDTGRAILRTARDSFVVSFFGAVEHARKSGEDCCG